jgi:hypothetical protein
VLVNNFETRVGHGNARDIAEGRRRDRELSARRRRQNSRDLKELGCKIRVTSRSWDDAKVIMPNQVFEIASISTQVGIVRVDKLGGLSRH